MKTHEFAGWKKHAERLVIGAELTLAALAVAAFGGAVGGMAMFVASPTGTNAFVSGCCRSLDALSVIIGFLLVSNTVGPIFQPREGFYW